MVATEQALSVRELTAHLKRVLEHDEVLREVVVRGEISNFTRHSSGHLYFCLKDEGALLGCVCFRGSAGTLRFAPADGQRVLAYGAVSVYEKQGKYQLMVRFMKPDGLGDLAAALEELRARLEREGLFAPERKRPLPRFPAGVALITSPTGAAVQDMITIIGRRYPLARVYLIPTVVQGEGAAPSIIASIERANRHPSVEVIIVGRGGGSLEDLWCFNDERVARAVFASRLPVISAVGHETDVTICDYVADMRAPTPSGAAELVVPDRPELQRHLDLLGRHLASRLESRLARSRRRLHELASHPLLQRPQMILAARAQRVDDAATGLRQAMERRLLAVRVRLDRASLAAAALNPLAVLGRGYAIVRRADDGAVVRRVGEVTGGLDLRITVSDGEFGAVASEG